MRSKYLRILQKTWPAMTILFFLAGCVQESALEKQQAEDNLKIQTYLKTRNIQAQQAANGLYYELIEENKQGRHPEVGEVMVVKYELRTLNGKLVESHRSDSTLLRFGWNYVIPNGFNYGLDIIRKGEKIRCYLPSHLSYNAYNAGSLFGAYTNFVLDLELVNILKEEEVYKHQIDQIEAYVAQEALGEITPTASGLYFQSMSNPSTDGLKAKAYHTVKIHYQRKYLDGTLIQKTKEGKPLSVQLGTNQLVEGFREGILKMRAGDKALLIMPSDIAFGPSVKVIPETLRTELWEGGYIGSLVDAYSPVLYEVELVEVK